MNPFTHFRWPAFAVAAALAWSHFLPVHAGPFDVLFGSRAGKMPSLEGGTGWVNAKPVTAEALRGKVVLVDFWTYSCINCLRTLPYVKAWEQKYKDAGLVIVGVHTPEFGFERRTDNVQRAVRDLGIGFPVVADGERRIWKAWGVQGWPTMVLLDAEGRIRGRQVGEGAYEETERTIQALLREAGRTHVPDGLVAPQGEGTQAAPGRERARTGETYLGAAQAHGFRAAAGRLTTGAGSFTAARSLALNEWTLEGAWTVEAERVCLREGSGRIAQRFAARDLHLVLGPAMDGDLPLLRVMLDGKPPAADKGSDLDAAGRGKVDSHRLYQLVRQASGAGERLFEVEFSKPGVCAYAFTYG